MLPCLVLAQLWVDPRWPGRLLLGCTTVAALCMYLQYLGDTVPDDTQGQAPLIGRYRSHPALVASTLKRPGATSLTGSASLAVLFYRNSLVMATMVVLLTVALRGIAERPGTPPPWLTGGSSWLLRTVPRPVTGMLLEEDDDDDDVDDDASSGGVREAAATSEQSEQIDKVPSTPPPPRRQRLGLRPLRLSLLSRRIRHDLCPTTYPGRR